MTMLQHGLVPSTGGYQIERSLRFNSADSAYLTRTPSVEGNRKTWTWSGWVKKSVFASQQGLFGSSGSTDIYLDGGDSTIGFDFYDASYNRTVRYTAAVYRDPSAWYHVVLALDTTQATDSNRIKLYINGVQISLSTAAVGTWPAQNAEGFINSTQVHSIGRRQSLQSSYFSGYLADVHFIDGSALTPSSFGENDTDTGVWKPKAYTGSYGTNGFKLTFSDNSGTTATTLGKDTSGNGNNWTPNNFSVTAGAGNDSLVDTPTAYGTDTGAGGEVRGNYCVVNPLDTYTGLTCANGNLDLNFTTASTAWRGSRATIGMSSGKWYWEVRCNDVAAPSGDPRAMLGIMTSQGSLASFVGSDANGWGYYSHGDKYTNGSGAGGGLASYQTGDIIGFAFDAGVGTLTFYKNGSSVTSFTGLASNTYFPAFSLYGSNTGSISVNFGQRPFAYTAPSGFKALCTTNLPTPTIGATSSTRADDYFNTVLYTGDRTSRTIEVGFQPDFVWVKRRSGADDHYLMNALSGTGKYLVSNSTAAEATNAATLTAFTSTGFSIGNTGTTNETSATYAAWNWKANGAGSSNTAGSITSTVSANTTSGFSIVTCSPTGSAFTVGHGLGVAPRFIIAKLYQSTADWNCYHASLGADKYIVLNSTSAALTSTTLWQNTAPTSTVLSFTAVSSPMLFYCFAPVAGYSAFGSYTGNGSADGPFIYTGFKPAYVLFKQSSASGIDWLVHDAKRSTYNAVNARLFPSLSNAESNGSVVDFVSNGFKIRENNDYHNANGATYIYAAFAENPFKYSLAR